MGAVVQHNSAAVSRCIAALDPAAALERDVGVAEGTNTTSRDACAVGDCALHQYSPRALPDGEPTWVRKKNRSPWKLPLIRGRPRRHRALELRVREKSRREGRVGPQNGDWEGLNMRVLPPTSGQVPVEIESRTLARSMRSELPAPCTSRPPPLVVVLPLTTWMFRRVRLAPSVTSMARDRPSASMVAPAAPMPSSVRSRPRTTSGEPPRG